MLDHIILTVSNVERSLAFYESALKPINIKFFLPYKAEGDHPDLWGFGDGNRTFFWIKQGTPDPVSLHWGFKAENNGKVDEFYRAAMSAGARDHISPRARVEYYPGYYAADVFDPDGYSFEVVHKANDETAHHYPTFQPTIRLVLYGFRVVWQFPRRKRGAHRNSLCSYQRQLQRWRSFQVGKTSALGSTGDTAFRRPVSVGKR